MSEIKLNEDEVILILELCNIGQCASEAFRDHSFRTAIGALKLRFLLEFDK